MARIKNDILSNHIIPQPLIIDENTNKYILNQEYINSNYATSDINGYFNTKKIVNHYNNIEYLNSLLDNKYYIPSIGELGLAFQNINKINQDKENTNYLDQGQSKIFLSSTLENRQENSFWVYNNTYGNILSYSEINESDNISTVFFKEFNNETLTDNETQNIINEDENIKYINIFNTDNIEVLSYLYYTNYNSTLLENNKNFPYYFMQYRMAYSYSIQESEPLFSYWLYGNNTINDFSINNMSYIYDEYEKTINKNGQFITNSKVKHNNFFNLKNPPTGSYIFPISYNINNIKDNQEVTININPYNSYYNLNNSSYFDPYGFKFYFILPFEYIFNKIKSQIKTYYTKNNMFKFKNNEDLKYHISGKFKWQRSRYADYKYEYISCENNSNLYMKFNSYGIPSGRGKPKPINMDVFPLTFIYFEYPFNLSELLLYTCFSETEINNLNIIITLKNYLLSHNDLIQTTNANVENRIWYLSDYESVYEENQPIKLQYSHGYLIRQYLCDHYLIGQNPNKIGKSQPIIQSLEMFLDLFGSIFYKFYPYYYTNSSGNTQYSYIYSNLFSYLNITSHKKDFYAQYSDKSSYYCCNHMIPEIYIGTHKIHGIKTLYNERRLYTNGSWPNLTYLPYEDAKFRSSVNYCDENLKRFYNVSPIKYTIFDENDNNAKKYDYEDLLTLSMKFNYENSDSEKNHYSLYYYTKDALIFICKKINSDINKSIQDIKSITFSLFFGSNNSNYDDVIKKYEIIPEMTFNLYFDKKNIYNLLFLNQTSYSYLNGGIFANNNYLIDNTINNINSIDNDDLCYYISSYYFKKDNIDVNSYLHQFSNFNNLLIDWTNSHYIQTPVINSNNQIYSQIKNRISNLMELYANTCYDTPINHKLSIKNSNSSWFTYFDVSYSRKFINYNDYPATTNDIFYQTLFIDNILANDVYIENSYFAKEFKKLPTINQLYYKNIPINTNNESYLPILRIWGHRNLNNIYDDYTIYKPTIINTNNPYHINIPSLGYKEVLYFYHEKNKDIINYLLSDYIIIVNKTNNKYNLEIIDNDKLSVLADLSEFNVIVNPFEIKILYPAVYNFKYQISYNINSSNDISIKNLSLIDFIRNQPNININSKIFNEQDVVYLFIKKLIQLINPDLNKICNYNNVIGKLNKISIIDKLINEMILNTQNIEIEQSQDLMINHCQNPFKGNIIFINKNIV